MNTKSIRFILGWILNIEALLMLLPVATAVVYREEEGIAYALVMAVCAAVGALMTYKKPNNPSFYAKEGFVCTALGWILMSAFGCVPFMLTGEIPSFIDAMFEMVSGFTTTGASVVLNVEELSHCTNMWRCFSHWIGGMGILVFMLAIVNMEGGQGIHLLRAESPGPTVSKMVPRMVDSSKILYSIYFGLTLVQILFYLLGGMPLFDTLCNAFATAGTGGFAIRADSFAGYGYYHQTVTTVFMALFGVNFSIYFFLLRRKFDLVWKNTELRWYVVIILSSVALITLNILPLYPRVYDALHHAAFSVSSIITTTGFGTADFAKWPEFSKTVLLILMAIGACAGSTGGGMKVSRVLILAKTARAETRHLLHPHSVEVMTMDGKRVSSEVIRGTMAFFICYAAIAVVSILLVSLDNFGAETSVTSVFATLNNIGPGLSLEVGPFGSYASFSALSKVVLTLDMLLGRLELFPVLLLLSPATWRKH